jgi:hypothetical protein
VSSPSALPSKAGLAKCLEDIVNTFYESDEISRIMPGKKDFKSMKRVVNGFMSKKADTW